MAGVDLRTEADCEAAFNHIDEVVGLKYLKVGSLSTGILINLVESASGTSQDQATMQRDRVSSGGHRCQSALGAITL